jgi:hypothetical protein
MSSNINEWTLSEIIARREHLAMCKRLESSTANIVESTEKALNAAETTNERHNLKVFEKALKLYREHLVRAREEVRAAEATIKDMEERMMPTESRWCLCKFRHIIFLIPDHFPYHPPLHCTQDQL